jgi:hypothetical protein
MRTANGVAVTLRLPHSVQTILLTAPLEESHLRNYSAVLATADGSIVRNFNDLRARMNRGGESLITFPVPSRLLKSGYYTLVVSGVDEAGTRQPAGGYSFQVIGE